MENTGEHLVGQYLKEILQCDFVEYNLQIKKVQGEIDVVGINTSKRKVYVCEVATHLPTGLQYTKKSQPDNVDRLMKKFRKDIEYAEIFKDYVKIFMFWTPIVKDTKEGSKHNQLKDLNEIKERIKAEKSIDLQLIYGKKYYDCIQELRDISKNQTKNMFSPIMRFMQIEEALKKNLKKEIDECSKHQNTKE